MNLKHKKHLLILLIIANCFICNNLFAETITDVQQLSGIWKNNECTITYPFTINDKNYFKIEYKKTDISKDWYNICEKRGLSFKESLIIKDVIISKVFDKDYPLANELGVNEGIKISYNDRLKKPKIKAQRIILIPEEVITYYLEYFELNGNRLQMTSPVPFGNLNSQIEDFYIDEKLRKKGLF